jgi:hypothetical protein
MRRVDNVRILIVATLIPRSLAPLAALQPATGLQGFREAVGAGVQKPEVVVPSSWFAGEQFAGEQIERRREPLRL